MLAWKWGRKKEELADPKIVADAIVVYPVECFGKKGSPAVSGVLKLPAGMQKAT